jgi:hypothetical protein
MGTKKKSGGGNLTRSQVVTVRFDPKLKFAAELAARKQRRTLSSFIEWAVEEAISRFHINDGKTMSEAINHVWDIEEADRFLKLALYYPELLSFEEERLWRIIKEYKPFWEKPDTGDYSVSNACLATIRNNWDILQQILAGDASVSELVPF